MSCTSKRKTVYSQHKSFSLEKEKYWDEDSTFLEKENSYEKLICFHSLPCRVAVKAWESNTKVPSGRDDMASYKSRHSSAAFNNLRQGEKHPRIYSNSITWDKKDPYQKHTVLKYIAIYGAVIIFVLQLFETKPRLLQNFGGGWPGWASWVGGSRLCAAWVPHGRQTGCPGQRPGEAAQVEEPSHQSGHSEPTPPRQHLTCNAVRTQPCLMSNSTAPC